MGLEFVPKFNYYKIGERAYDKKKEWIFYIHSFFLFLIIKV